MGQKFIDYEFINGETGNVIGYLSLPADIYEDERLAELEKKRTELALTNGLYVEAIYWQKHD